jgi:DNA-binding MarR family transcriptional regulator
MVGAVSLTHRLSPVRSDGEQLVTSVHEVMRLVLHRLHPVLEDEGISMGQFWSLHLVSALPDASVTDIARHLSVSCPTVSASVDQLEESGLIARRRSTHDRRSVELSLTPKGRRVEARVWAALGGTMAEAAGDLPRADVAVAVRVFQGLSRRLETSSGFPGDPS